MYLGHIGAGMALKKVEPKVNVGVLIFAALFLDELYYLFILLGLEQPVDTKAERRALTILLPYSHGIIASVLWTLLVAGLVWLIWGRAGKLSNKGILAIAAATFSHFVLDVIAYMTILDASSLLIVQMMIAALGIGFYFWAARDKKWLYKGGAIAALVIISLLETSLMEVLPFDPSKDMTVLALISFLFPFPFCGVVYWFDRDRTVEPLSAGQ